jgi:hypothetical protein
MTTKKKPDPAPQTNDAFEAALKSEPVVYNVVTLGISPRVDGGYNIIKIPVDSKGLTTGEVEILDTAENKWEANEKFKISVVKLGVI